MNFCKEGFPIFDDEFDISYLTDDGISNKVNKDNHKPQDDKPQIKDKPKIKPLF